MNRLLCYGKAALQTLVAEQKIRNCIYVIRGQKVMPDRDLAQIYGVETKTFNQSVKRNTDRFPKDFMFKLSEKEWENLRSQIVTSSCGGTRYRPRVLNQGVKRNSKRFPKDVMSAFTRKELENLISHFVTSNRGCTCYNPGVL